MSARPTSSSDRPHPPTTWSQWAIWRTTRTLTTFWPAVLTLAVVALVLRLPQLDQAAHFDELYHLLAARSWLADGSFVIAEGSYERAALFTRMVGIALGLFGDGSPSRDLVAARLPSLVLGVVMVVAVFVWTRREAGVAAAWIAGLLLAFSPLAVSMSQFARFYMLHALAFWIAVVTVHALASRPAAWPLQAGRTVLALAALLLALDLQDTTLIGIAGLALWAVLVHGLPWLRALPLAMAVKAGLVAAVLLAGLAAGFALLSSPFGAVLLHSYRWSPLWSAEHRDAFWFYHLDFVIHYPTLWTLVPLAALVAVARRPSPALLAFVLFVTAFVVHSFGGRKDARYMFYVLPFLFVLWAIAIAEIWPWLRRTVPPLTDRALRALGVGTAALAAMRRGAIAAMLLFVVAAQGATIRTAAMIAGITIPPMQPRADLASARDDLVPRVAQATLVLTTTELETLFYLGRYDVLISRSRMTEIPGGEEFGRDPRTGRPAIGTADSLERLMRCYADGVFVSTAERWRNPAQIDNRMSDIVVAHAEPIPLTRARRVVAYHWQRPAGPLDPDCAQLPELTGVPLTAP